MRECAMSPSPPQVQKGEQSTHPKRHCCAQTRALRGQGAAQLGWLGGREAVWEKLGHQEGPRGGAQDRVLAMKPGEKRGRRREAEELMWA